MTSGIMAFLHHLAAFTLVGSLIYEHTTFRKDLSFAEARRIQHMDLIYGISAGLILIVGLLPVFFFEKGASFYAHNLFFWTKMFGFGLAALLSIYPTTRFGALVKSLGHNQTPRMSDQEVSRIKTITRFELLAVVLMLFSAAMMARGVGMI